MVNLHNGFRDPNSRSVLSILEHEIAGFENNAVLEKLRQGTYSDRQFGFIAKARLDAATRFTHFLSAAEDKAREKHGWSDVANAMRENLDEELGLTNGSYDPKKDHNEWRKKFRIGLHRVLALKQIDLNAIDTQETTYDIGVFYGGRMEKMAREEDAPYLAGAFTVLEGILEQEFTAMLLFIRHALQDLTSDEEFYITHHAGHEKTHFHEAARPLLKKCAESPHVVDEVVRGITDMVRLRSNDVLGRIELNLWKAEKKS